MNGARIELLDNAKSINQLCALERKTARSGKDSIDHPPKQRNDVINTIAGAAVHAHTAQKRMFFAVPDMSGARPSYWAAPYGMSGGSQPGGSPLESNKARRRQQIQRLDR